MEFFRAPFPLVPSKSYSSGDAETRGEAETRGDTSPAAIALLRELRREMLSQLMAGIAPTPSNMSEKRGVDDLLLDGCCPINKREFKQLGNIKFEKF